MVRSGCHGEVKMAAKSLRKTRKRDEDRRMSGVESINKYMPIRAYGLGASDMSYRYHGV